jgi:hypothetical protein
MNVRRPRALPKVRGSSQDTISTSLKHPTATATQHLQTQGWCSTTLLMDPGVTISTSLKRLTPTKHLRTWRWCRTTLLMGGNHNTNRRNRRIRPMWRVGIHILRKSIITVDDIVIAAHDVII